jgi:hypothetical protein
LPAAFHSVATSISSQRGAGVGHDAEVGPNTRPIWVGSISMWTNLRSLVYTSMRTGVAVGPAVADAEHEVAGQHRRVAVAVAGLQAAMPAISL